MTEPIDTPQVMEDDPKSNTSTPKSTRELLMSGMYSMGDRVAALVFGFGTLWMLTRLTSQANFGVWVFFTGLVATVEVARTGLLQNALIRYLTTTDEKEHGAIHGGAWLLNGSIAFLGALFLWFGGDYLEPWFNFPGLGSLTKIYALTFFAMTPLWQFNYIQQAHLEFRGAFWATILRYSTMFLLTLSMFVAFIQVDGNSLQILEYLAWGQLVAASLGAFISYYYAKKYIPKNIILDISWTFKLIGFGIFVFGTNLSSMLYKQVDTAMLGALLLGPVPAAIYGLAIRITNFVDVPTLAVASIVFPESSRVSADGPDAQARMYEKATSAILAFVLPALLIVGLLPGFIVEIVGGAKYSEAIPVLQLTVLFSLFIPFANQFGTLLDASGKPHLNFGFTVSGMLLNVAFNYYFISNMGITGAPLGTLSTYVVMFVAMQILLYKMYGVRLINVLKALPKTYAMIWDFGLHKIGLRA